MFLVWFSDLKFASELAANDVANFKPTTLARWAATPDMPDAMCAAQGFGWKEPPFAEQMCAGTTPLRKSQHVACRRIHIPLFSRHVWSELNGADSTMSKSCACGAR
jgi:hypothetical protein